MQITPGKWYQRNGLVAEVKRALPTGSFDGTVMSKTGHRFAVIWDEHGKVCSLFDFADLVCPYDEPIERPAKPTREVLMAERPI